jgi:hypothetical protein
MEMKLLVLILAILLILPIASVNAKVVKVEMSDKTQHINPLPVKVFLKCKWEKGKDSGAGGFYLDIWLIGFGKHRVEIKRYCDFDGDGIWDFNDASPNVWDIIIGIIPFHHFRGLDVSWSGYPGKCHVKIKIWVDGSLVKEKDFTEPWD